MPKRCIVCTEEATFRIKDTSDYYCDQCADDNFADLSMLLKVEEEARLLKGLVAEKMRQELDEQNN